MQKNRNVMLDVMRGLAGLAVPMMHLREGFGWTGDFCGHTYFAVEFYILLMAYMFGSAYDRRWSEGMGVLDFAKRRLRRMHILVLSGFVLSMAVWGLQLAGFAWAGKSHMEGSAGMQIWWVVAALLMLPAFGNSLIAPLNACSWTLYYQYLGNILYAAGVRRFSKTALAAASALSALTAVVFVFHPDLNALLGVNCEYFAHLARRTYTLQGGWGMNDMQITSGFVRLGFPLFFGLLLFRTGWRIRLPKHLATPLVAGLFVALMYTPATGVFHPWKADAVLNGVFDLSVMFFFMPIMLLVAVGSESYGGRFAKVAAFFGRLSFPVYMSHYMFMSIHRHYVKTYSGNLPDWGNYLVFAGEYFAILLVGYCVMRFWEKVQSPGSAICGRTPCGNGAAAVDRSCAVREDMVL